MRVVHLNGSLAEPHQIGSDPYGSARDLRGQTMMFRLSAGCGLCSRKILLIVRLSASVCNACVHVCALWSVRACAATSASPGSWWWSPRRPRTTLQRSCRSLSDSPRPALHLFQWCPWSCTCVRKCAFSPRWHVSPSNFYHGNRLAGSFLHKEYFDSRDRNDRRVPGFSLVFHVFAVHRV